MSGLIPSASSGLSRASGQPYTQHASPEYSGPSVLVWDDFPQLIMLGSGQPVESLVQEPATIKRQCLIYQKRIAWAAFRTEIIYVVLLRPLELKEWNKYVLACENNALYSARMAPVSERRTALSPSKSK